MFLNLNSVHICTRVWQTTMVYQLYTTAAAFDLRCESDTYTYVVYHVSVYVIATEDLGETEVIDVTKLCLYAIMYTSSHARYYCL